MRFLILALALAFPTSSALADIGWHTERMAPGSHFVMQDEAGTVTHVKRGADRDRHDFDLFAGEGSGAVFIGSYRTNARGEVTATIAADGAVTRFAPHRCSRSVGRCAFTVVHPGGFEEPRIRMTEVVAGGLRYREYGLDGLLTEGALELDANGAARRGWKRDRNDTRKTRTQRTIIALK